MILFGEKLNSSIPATRRAMAAKNADSIRRLCTAQEEAGADYLDINTALFTDQEWETMRWALDIALESTGCGVMIDTPSVEVGRQALEYVKDRPVIFNSITLNDRVELADTIAEKGCGVVALPIGGHMPTTARERFSNAIQLSQLLVECGVKPADIYMDVLVSALATAITAGTQALEAVSLIRESLPGIHVTCGLSNISFGLPQRKYINAAFLQFAMERGLDSAILDVTNTELRLSLLAAAAVLGKDDYCMDYVMAAK